MIMQIALSASGLYYPRPALLLCHIGSVAHLCSCFATGYNR